jgi:cytoskeletal protein CcmA (bactofilin family)
MFGSKKTVEEVNVVGAKSTVPANDNALNSLVRGTTIEGSVVAESDIRIDGIIRGTLTCSAKVIIGPTGLIDGEVKCQNAVIEGKFYGKLKVADLLSVKESAEIVADVITSKLSVAPGAIFDVTCKMRTDAKPQPKPVKEELVQSNGNGAGKKQ